jgi:hypothetical protein
MRVEAIIARESEEARQKADETPSCSTTAVAIVAGDLTRDSVQSGEGVNVTAAKVPKLWL